MAQPVASHQHSPTQAILVMVQSVERIVPEFLLRAVNVLSEPIFVRLPDKLPDEHRGSHPNSANKEHIHCYLESIIFFNESVRSGAMGSGGA